MNKQPEYRVPKGVLVPGTRIAIFEHDEVRYYRKPVSPTVFTATVDGITFPGYYRTREAAILAASELCPSKVQERLGHIYSLTGLHRAVTLSEVRLLVRHLETSPNPC